MDVRELFYPLFRPKMARMRGGIFEEFFECREMGFRKPREGDVFVFEGKKIIEDDKRVFSRKIVQKGGRRHFSGAQVLSGADEDAFCFLDGLLTDRIEDADGIDGVAKKIDAVGVGRGRGKISRMPPRRANSPLSAQRAFLRYPKEVRNSSSFAKETVPPFFHKKHCGRRIGRDGPLQDRLQGADDDVRGFLGGESIKRLKSFSHDIGAWRDLFSGKRLPSREVEAPAEAQNRGKSSRILLSRGSDVMTRTGRSFKRERRRALGASQRPSMRREGSCSRNLDKLIERRAM